MFDISQYLGLPLDGSSHGQEIDFMMSLVHWLMLFLFLFWAPFFLYTLYRFRASKQPKAIYGGVKTKFSTYLEAVVVLAEVVLLFGFAFPQWANLKDNFPVESESTVVHVVAEQFKWYIHYPGVDGEVGERHAELVDTQTNPLGLDPNDANGQDDIISSNLLYLPVNKPVTIYLSSKDVIHSFALPNMRVKQDAIPGLSIPIWFEPTMTTTEYREQMARSFSGDKLADLSSRWVAMDDYDGIVSKGGRLSRTVKEQLAEAGITSVLASPPDMEISCAQLCGPSHFSMRGFLRVVSQAEFDAWLQEEAARL